MMRHRARLAAAAALSLAGLTADTLAQAAPCWRPPVTGQIVDHFRAPACRYCAGNRGLDYRTAAGAVVRAVDAGRVTFSGAVAGTRYVVVEHVNGWKVTYGGLDDARVQRGDAIVRGVVVGHVDRRLYFGLRVGGAYRDPAPFFGRLVGRPRLVPVDGTGRRPIPAAAWSCRP